MDPEKSFGNPLYDEELSEELEFRRSARLCMRCGMARREHPGTTLCYDCSEEFDLELIRSQWRRWGIAA